MKKFINDTEKNNFNFNYNPSPIQMNMGMNNHNNMYMMGMNNNSANINNYNNMGIFGMNDMNSFNLMNNGNPIFNIMQNSTEPQVIQKDKMQMMSQMNQNNINNYNNIDIIGINNINQQLNNLNYGNNTNTLPYITVFFIASNTNSAPPIKVQVMLDDKVSSMIEKYRNKSGDKDYGKKFIFNAFDLESVFDSDSQSQKIIIRTAPNIKNGDHIADLTIVEAGISNYANIFVVATKGIKGAGGVLLSKEINIKFIKNDKKIVDSKDKSDSKLFGLLKLSLLKEISVKLDDLDDSKYKKLSDIIIYILKILKNGYIEYHEPEKNIKDILKKIKGSNIINFSRYVDEIINQKELENIINLLKKEELNEINDIKNRLSPYKKYILFFENEFEKAKKESIFEFSVVSLVVMEREDFEIFAAERDKCPNSVDKILFHGTSIEPISCILTGYFRKSINKCFQHGKGVYFTDLLDYCWFYGGAESNRANKNKIPKIGDTFTLIASSIYYDKTKFKRVFDYKYTPKKNEINFAYAGCKFETLKEKEIDKTKFYGTEYVIWDLNQICPIIGAKLKRSEFCVIWRDTNFSEKPIYNNSFDKIFKDFLKERKKYIQQMANYNIYTFNNSEEALAMIKRKKYNKIILLSNIGSDYGGKDFISNARKIIGNDVIALFLAYNEKHLKWVTKYKNSLFSNSSTFYEEYLECFNEYNVKDSLKKLKEKLEKHYDVKFNFDEKFLDFPLFKESGNYSDLSF